MTVTRLGRDFPLLTAGMGSTTQVPPGGSSGQVPTANGSNGVEWGENIARITANGSNALLGPFANFISGSGVTLSVSSNSMTITAGSAFDTMPWFNVEDYGAVHDGVTDDTPAIQAAINACMAAGGGTVFSPNGIYAIKGALQSTGTYNSQLTITQNALTGGLTAPPVAIRFLGMGPPGQSNNGATGAWLPSESGAIWLSDWNGVISGSPAVIAAGKVDAQFPAASFNWVQVTFENMEIRTHANPKLSAIQMRAAVTCSALHVTISTDTASAGMALPSNTNAIGIDLPLAINSNPPDLLHDVFVDGYYTGIRTSEQTNGSTVTVTHCTRGMQFTGGVGSPTYIRHANQFGKIVSVACPRVLVFDTDERWVTIQLLQIEHDSSVFATFGEVYDIDDASNYARGFIGWHVTDYTTGPEDHLLVNGATGLSLHGFYVKRWKLNNVVDVPIGTNPSTNPADGRRLYAASATGHLTGRKSDGTLNDYETDWGGVTVSGTPSTGQVPTATGTTTATWQTSSGGSSSRILLADGHATPFAFNDMLQMDDGSDFMWSD